MRCEPGDPCDDGNPCTVDTCLAEGVCAHANRADCCTVDQDCADKPCMQKSCDRRTNSCTYLPTRPGVPCGGGCQGPQVAVLPGKCNERGDCCDADGVCPPKVVACPTDDDVCTDDICDPEAGCVHRTIPAPDCCHNDAECDDGNACTTDTCRDAACTYDLVSPTCLPCAKDTDCGGQCLGRACVGGVCTDVAPFSCTKPGTACRLDASGQPFCGCTDSRGCDDGDACNGKEMCVTGTGTCVAGTPIDCDDGNLCTIDTCLPQGACAYAIQV